MKQAKSPKLTVARLQPIHRKQSFTLHEAATYWCGYLEILDGDTEAKADFRLSMKMLIDAVKDGLKLAEEKTKSVRKDAGGFSTHWADDVPPSCTQKTDWPRCVVSRADLLAFAKSIGECPAFLFPKGEATGRDTDNMSERRAPTLGRMLAAIIEVKYGKGSLENIGEDRSKITATIIEDIRTRASCKLSDRAIRDALKDLPDIN